ncbi:MAG: ribosome small subunit-dependent GTPase A [Treponema sp.]|jgi:ribosome biogenesis GTPase|nr:ribosome small subunit-dependent GTPase A [Treponema sp.]
MIGLVIRGSRNIFTVRIFTESGEVRYLECRLKGKILKGADAYHNPLAPGDRVLVEAAAEAPGQTAQGQIIGLQERRTIFTRRNTDATRKGQRSSGTKHIAAAQILAANADLVLAVTTPASPPFRPRFLDRTLVQADAAGIPAAIICNKQDLCDSAGDDLLDVEERLEDFRRIGYPVLMVSAKTGAGMAELRELIQGRFSVLVGQSGVGKSSIVNALLPQANVRVGILNEKYDRGNHTTTQGEIIEIPGADGNITETFIIDTPGIRLFSPDGVHADDLILYLREFAPLAGQCSYGLSCTHRTEPGCKILEAVSAGVIHEDRYDSFIRMVEELAEERR